MNEPGDYPKQLFSATVNENEVQEDEYRLLHTFCCNLHRIFPIFNDCIAALDHYRKEILYLATKDTSICNQPQRAMEKLEELRQLSDIETERLYECRLLFNEKIQQIAPTDYKLIRSVCFAEYRSSSTNFIHKKMLLERPLMMTRDYKTSSLCCLFYRQK